jgi:hypothetical protein
MKRRSGFVSNSSSSSFIVAFPKGFVPTRGTILDYLFPDLDAIVNPYHEDESFSSGQAARYIMVQMQGQTPNDQTKIDEALGGWLPDQPDFPYYSNETSSEERLKISAAWEKERRAHAKRWWRENQKKLDPKNSDLYVFWFGDENGSFEAALEYGPTFNAVPSLKISHH